MSDIQKIYFVGIGGIGMSALARYFQSVGVSVFGYDKTVTQLTNQLTEEGMKISYQDDISNIPADIDLVVYTPAIPAESNIMSYFKSKGFEMFKRSDVLQQITEGYFNICFAGTHGKTTMSTMTAHVLRHAGYGCNAFLGGIAADYNTNFWSDANKVCVIEADEYDRSFLKLSPDIAVISAMDADHLDIYGTAGNMEQAFIDFTSKIKAGGILFSRYGLTRANDLVATTHYTYGIKQPAATVHAENIRIENGAYRFDVLQGTWHLPDVVLNMGGLHNVENSVAAIAIAHELEIPDDKIVAAMETFRGVKRRFEYVVKNERVIYIDDYAHHPEELKALITGVKELFPSEKCTIVFQPHLYTRTRDLAKGFAESLDLADQVLLLPIYPARELPIEGVDSNVVLKLMKNKNVQLISKEGLLEWIRANKSPLLITAGAGDIDQMVQPISELLNSK